MGFVYKITNNINGKMYIGKTQYADANKRWKEHLSDAKKSKNANRPIYKAINKYGPENFTFETIYEHSEPECLSLMEKQYIEQFRTYVGYVDCNGYNATLGGDGKSYLNLDHADVARVHLENCCDLRKTAESFGVDSGTIKKILQYYNIPWKSHEIITQQNAASYHNGIYQIDINTLEILNIFNTVKEANIYFGKKPSSSNIGNACHKYNGVYKAYGYYWCYGEDYEDFIKQFK